jgi:HAMP domain-containing protein
VSKLPIRLRLALAFALAMALVLSAVGALLYVRLGDSLLEQVDDNLEGLAQSVAGLAVTGNLAELTGEEALVQVIGPGERLLSQPRRIVEPVISEVDSERANEGPYFADRDAVAGFDGAPVRLRVSSGVVDGEQVTIVVGASLEDREEALDGLLAQFLVVGPLALLLSSLAGYFLAAAALRPVEAMRRQADEVSSERPGQRLPLPAANDEIRRLGETLNEMLARL